MDARQALEAAAKVADGYADTKPVPDKSDNPTAAAIIAAVMSDTGRKIAAAIRSIPVPEPEGTGSEELLREFAPELLALALTEAEQRGRDAGLAHVSAALAEYRAALKRREHGGLAADNLVRAVERLVETADAIDRLAHKDGK